MIDNYLNKLMIDSKKERKKSIKFSREFDGGFILIYQTINKDLYQRILLENFFFFLRLLPLSRGHMNRLRATSKKSGVELVYRNY